MDEFNWTADDIKRAQRDFSNNFMRLDCIRTESYDVAIDCMTECIEKKAADVQLVISGDNCIVCGRDVRKDNVYYDVNGGTICESCMNTKCKCKNGR